MPNLSAALVALQSIVRRIPVVHWFQAARFPDMLDGNRLALPSAVAGGHIESDSVQPSVKRGGALERLQLHERLHKGVLDNVPGVFRVAGHMDDGVVEPILIFVYQLAERRRVARQCLVDQLGVVVHSRLTI